MCPKRALIQEQPGGQHASLQPLAPRRRAPSMLLPAIVMLQGDFKPFANTLSVLSNPLAGPTMTNGSTGNEHFRIPHWTKQCATPDYPCEPIVGAEQVVNMMLGALTLVLCATDDCSGGSHREQATRPPS